MYLCIISTRFTPVLLNLEQEKYSFDARDRQTFLFDNMHMYVCADFLYKYHGTEAHS
jgi:hypothetical protein